MKKIENIKEDDDELRRSLVKEYLEQRKRWKKFLLNNIREEYYKKETNTIT